MYAAKLNDRGKASYVYMFDEQLFELDDLFSKSYYMMKSSDQQQVKEFCHKWNSEHKEIIRKNKLIYYFNVMMKGLLQAPALVVLYSCIVIGAMLIFGSEIFYENVLLYGVAAFGTGVRNTVTIVYVISAAVGLLASLSTYNNIFYKLIRSLFSIAAFVIISPVFFEKVFFSNSNTMLTYTIIGIVGCFFVRILIDRLLTSIIRKKTEMLIRKAHENPEFEEVSAVETPYETDVTENEDLQPLLERVRKGERVKQYRKNFN